MAYTQEQLDKLLAIRARGILTIRDADGRTTTYQSGADLDRVIEAARRDVAAAEAAAAGRPIYVRRYAEHHRG